MKYVAIGCIAVAVAISGCTVKETVVKPAETPPPVAVYQVPPPVVQTPTEGRSATIVYTVMGQQQFNQAAVQAANWCRANYGTDARLVDQSRSTAGDLVTFACVTG